MKVVKTLSYADAGVLEVGEFVEVELADPKKLPGARSNICQFGAKTDKKFSVSKMEDAGGKCIVRITRNS